MRAILKCTDSLQDSRIVFCILGENDVEILRTKELGLFNREITILINNRKELNMLLAQINRNCLHEVQLVKTQKSRRCDTCQQRDCCSAAKKLFCILGGCPHPNDSDLRS